VADPSRAPTPVRVPCTRTAARLLSALVALAAPGCAHGFATAARPAPVAEQPAPEPGRARAPDQSRLLIRRAAMSLVVDDVPTVAERTRALASRLGGYVERSELRGESGMAITLRIPTPSLDAALDTLAALGEVRHRSTSTTDVTEHVIDLQARVASLRATRDRLRQLLEQASRVTEVLEVERELARVQAELDALEGRLAHLTGSIELAELSLDVDRRRVLGPLGYVLAGAGWVVEKLFVIR
jgi:hypothetical protein